MSKREEEKTAPGSQPPGPGPGVAGGRLSRRELIQLAALSAGGVLLAACKPTYLPSPAAGPPSEPAVTNADQALQILLEGNRRFVAGTSLHTHEGWRRRIELTQEQHPFALIHGCSDSRAPVQLVFDQGLGDLFVTRVAGNIVDDAILGSMEFAVFELHVPLILVLGHSKCGAVAATVEAVEKGGMVTAHVNSLVRAIKPAVIKAQERPGDLLENAVRTNVELVVDLLRVSRPVLASWAETGRLKIVGAYYDTASGLVEVIVP